jgi:23S rRNA (pseudouridine1915-N3)-methyltransferase
MRLVVIVVGRPRDSVLGIAAREYETRACHYWPLTVIEVKEESARGRSPEFVKGKEGDRILAHVPPGGSFIACVERGTAMTSDQFSHLLRRNRDEDRDVALAVGGTFGLAEGVVQAASFTLSLAPWTLPHELARVVLAEQIYRAGTIVRGEPYHKR